MAPSNTDRWLLLAHQLPSEPSKLRVKIWRRLHAVGAVLINNSVYVLPNSSETREDFEWIRSEILAQGGDAAVFTADAVDDLTTDEVVDSFVSARSKDWQELHESVSAMAESADAIRSTTEGEGASLERELKTLRNRATQIDKIDYFQAPGRQRALEAMEALIEVLRPHPAGSPPSIPSRSPEDFRGRCWLTRPRPGVDRMASAWLIHRFIDPDAEFRFAEKIPSDTDVIPFDMFGVELGHQGNHCTFETLVAAFDLRHPPLAPIARIVHDLDLRSDSPTDSETATIGRLVAGLRQATTDDTELLARGMTLFEALYCSYDSEPKDD